MVLRLSAWGIFLLGAVGLLIHSTLLQTGHIRAGMFCFYTNLSNLLVLVYELALAIAAGLPHSAVLRLLTDDTLSFSMALCILVTIWYISSFWCRTPSEMASALPTLVPASATSVSTI